MRLQALYMYVCCVCVCNIEQLGGPGDEVTCISVYVCVCVCVCMITVYIHVRDSEKSGNYTCTWIFICKLLFTILEKRHHSVLFM